MSFIFNRIKAILLFLIGILRRALCCFRTRRKSFLNDADECLTDVGIVPNRYQQDGGNWDTRWNDDPINQPHTIEDHIQMYRDKLTQPAIVEHNKQEEELDHIFQEMTPQYVRQKKVVIGNSNARSRSSDTNMSRLSVSDSVLADDLGEWVEENNTGWDEQHMDPLDILKEQRRIKRENRQQNTGLGRKLKT